MRICPVNGVGTPRLRRGSFSTGDADALSKYLVAQGVSVRGEAARECLRKMDIHSRTASTPRYQRFPTPSKSSSSLMVRPQQGGSLGGIFSIRVHDPWVTP
jgi:hypothetical protein